MLDTATAWFSGNPLAVGALGALSLALIATTVLATPWLVGRLPPDYFLADYRPSAGRGPWRIALLAARNLVGAAFIVLGVLMMLTPGPGLVALLLGLSLCEFPGRHALISRIATRPAVFAALNRLRRQRGLGPFEPPAAPR